MGKLWANKPKEPEEGILTTSGDYGITIGAASVSLGTSYDTCLKSLVNVGSCQTSAPLPAEPSTGSDWLYCKIRFVSIDGEFYPEFLDEINGYVYTPEIFHDPMGDRLVYRKYVYNGS